MTYGARRGMGAARSYANIGLETQVLGASPQRLISLLFDGARAAVGQARLHLEQGNIAARGAAISKAIDIVETGLKASLDMKAGGELATNLATVYDLIIRDLLLANLNSDATRLASADRLLADIGGAWREAVDPVAPAGESPSPG